MGAFVAACDAIRQQTAAAVVVVHHTGKNLAQGSRGSSLLPAAVDGMIEVTKEEKTEQHVAEHVKSRDGETGAILASATVVPLGEDADRDPITSCIVEPIEEAAGKKGAALTGDETAFPTTSRRFSPARKALSRT